MEKIKILISGIGRYRGGIGSVVYNVICNMDKTKFEPVILLTYDSVTEKDFAALGVEIKKITPFGQSLKLYKKELEKVFAEGRYDYVWINNTSKVDVIIFRLAKKYGVKTIAHSHGECVEGGLAKKLLYKSIEFFTAGIFYKNLDIALSCSQSSADYFYSKRYRKTHKVNVLRNSIDTGKFRFDEDMRQTFRKELGIDREDIAIVSVGRITEVKNPLFLTDVLKKLPENYKLVYVGDGEMKEELMQKILAYGLENRVILTGIRSDVAQLLNAMDVFVLPSFHEGFPVSAIEAQANGLNCVISDRVSDECVITDLCSREKLDASVWAEKISSVRQVRRETYADMVKEKGYDNQCYAKEFENIILKDKANVH